MPRSTAFTRKAVCFCAAFIATVKAGRAEEGWKSFMESNTSPGTWNSYPDDNRYQLLFTTDPAFFGYYPVMTHPTNLEELHAIVLPAAAMCAETTSPRLRRPTEIIAGKIPPCGLELISGAGHRSPITHPNAVAGKLEGHFRTVGAGV